MTKSRLQPSRSKLPQTRSWASCVLPRVLWQAVGWILRAQQRSGNKRERIGRIVLLKADDRIEVKEVYAGDIVALVGLERHHDRRHALRRRPPILLESMKFPEPVISVAIEPKTKADSEKIGHGTGAPS